MKKYIISTIVIAVYSILAITACDKSSKDERFTNDPNSWVTVSEKSELLEDKAVKWDFAILDGWTLANQGNDDIDHTSIADNADCEDNKALRIYTEANSQQRKKVRTVKQYGSGLYTWRIYISDLGDVERVSIGSWLWHDDEHELDFEVGSGTSEERAALQLTEDEVIAYITCQAHPWVQQKVRIQKNTWHIFQIDLKLVNGKYFATWLIDDVSYAAQQLSFGEDYPFYIFCSIENLKFIGDTWPYKDNYGLWDYTVYTPYLYSMEPITPHDPTNPVDPEPEPDEGETVTWNFDDGNIPGGWSVWTSVGGDGPAYYGVQDGYLNLSNDSYCTTSRITYSTPVGFGKYTWNIRFPALAGAEKFMAGGTLYTSNESNGYHTISITGWYGSDDERSRLGATGNQLLMRVYSEIPAVDKNVAVLTPDTDYKLTVELKKVNNKYVFVWLLDESVMQTLNTTYGPDNITFLFIASAESNRAWMPGYDISGKYTAKFNYIEYTVY
ncbi:MAG: toxin-antitoxin system protein [Prevotellaceae bacterium]|jgi:hypothetical protein|nr:toxin-antitoxin system protein [Prevotellaceae bacterium]